MVLIVWVQFPAGKEQDITMNKKNVDLQQQEVQKMVTLERFMDSFRDALHKAMAEGDISQNELARRLGQTSSNVSQALASGNMTASTMANMAAAVGYRMLVEFRPIR